MTRRRRSARLINGLAAVVTLAVVILIAPRPAGRRDPLEPARRLLRPPVAPVKRPARQSPPAPPVRPVLRPVARPLPVHTELPQKTDIDLGPRTPPLRSFADHHSGAPSGGSPTIPRSAMSPIETSRAPAILTVVINEVVVGTEIIYFDGSAVLVPVAALERGRLTVRVPVRFLDRTPYVALGALPLRFVIDETAMKLVITAGADQFPRTTIDLATVQRPADLEVRQDTSLYVNYGVHSVGTHVDAFTEAGLRIGAALAYGSLIVLRDHRIVRGLTKVVWDRRAALQRIVAGDELVDGGPLGGGAVVGGAHLVRSFELDPYLVTSPSIDLSSTVLAPSTADVYVNGVMVRSVSLAPGQYTLANLPVTTGSGDVHLVIRDALGRQQQLTTGYYQPARLLKAGLSDYHVAAGAVRSSVGVESFEYGGPITVARYARGLTSRVTAGLRADAALGHAGAGASITAALPVGQIDAAISTSTDHGTLGVAAVLGLSFSSRRGSLSVSGRRISSQYATLDTDGHEDRATTDLRLQAGLAIRSQVSIGAQLSAIELRDEGWSTRTSVNATSSVVNRLVLSVSAGRTDEWGHSAQYDVMANAGITLGARTRASAAYARHADVDHAVVELHRSLGNEPGIGYRALADVGDDVRASAGLQAQTRFGRFSAAYTYDRARGGTTELTAAGGLAVIGGRVFASVPIDQSFALVRVPGVRGVGALLENHRAGDTDERGDVFVPNLQSYYGNHLSIRAADVPFERQLTVTDRIVAPPLGGGVVVTFAAPTLRVIRGRIVIDRKGGPAIPAYGDLSVATLVSPLNAEGSFELDGITTGSHPATVTWEGGACHFPLAVSDDANPIVDMGVLRCSP